MSLTSLALQMNSLPLAPPGKLKSWPIAVTLKSAGYQHDNSFHAQSCCSVIKQTCEVRMVGLQRGALISVWPWALLP